ncbi:CorA family divalent cation transporter [Microbacterium kyungheense]|uniref:Magnesium transporter n=1 Tax=Microbacterium kyungheense TaxID=1263636 RepID=A0A543ERR2_9MICO|nr:CorA family divalent cation transporter [Microbacterium kyungheense]TQM24268.1 magnesium transporter [Microbacterium kyungheense]
MGDTAVPDGQGAQPGTGDLPQLRAFLLAPELAELPDFELASTPKLVARARRHDQFAWLHVTDPDEETVRAARKILGIHPIAAADVASGRQQPKVQKFDEHLFVMLWSILESDDGEGLVLGQTFLYIGEGWLLIVQRAEGGKLTDLRAPLEEAPPELRNGTMPAAYTIMADVVDGYAKAAADVETELEKLEEQVFSDTTDEDHREIYRVRKDIGRVDRAVSSIAAALRESTSHLESLTVGKEHIVPYLHDLLDDAAGTAALINNQSKALDAVLSSHENNVAARQNKDMRTISAVAAMLAPPTLIAGLYGMNFKNIPLVQWEYGWVAIGIAIVAIDVVIYVMFKRRRWL